MTRRALTAWVALALLTSASAAAAPPVVDIQSSSPATTVGREQLERLPSGRNLADLIKACPSQTIPTVASRPQMVIAGVPSSQSPPINCVRPDDLRMIEVYKAHNVERAQYGYQPLVWNPVLATNAQAHANRLAEVGQLVHASREGRGTERESISQGLPGWNINQMMNPWFREKQYFTPGIFPDVSTTGNWSDIGHYTAIIWLETTDIGCGMTETRVHVWLVCRYNPGGNKDGKPVGFMQTPQIAAADGGGTAPGSRNDLGRSGSLFDLGIDRACAPWNIFQEGQVTQEALQYLQTPGFSRGVLNDAVAHIDSTIVGDEYGWRMPWSEQLGFNAGAEYRKESMDFDVDELFFPQTSGLGCR